MYAVYMYMLSLFNSIYILLIGKYTSLNIYILIITKVLISLFL